MALFCMSKLGSENGLKFSVNGRCTLTTFYMCQSASYKILKISENLRNKSLVTLGAFGKSLGDMRILGKSANPVWMKSLGAN